MTGKTHAAIGANIAWILSPMLGGVLSPEVFVLAVFGALLTDIDAAESKIKRLEVGYGKGKRRIAIQPFYLPAVIIATFFRHRGFWHSLLANILVAFISFQVVLYLNAHYTFLALKSAHALAAPLGYLSHILADSLTKHGVPLLWPWKKNFYLLPQGIRAKTGHYLDQLLFVIAIIGVILLVLRFIASHQLSLEQLM